MIVRTLGSSEIVVGSETIGAERPLVFALLLLVALAHPRRLARTQLATELWPAAAAPERHHRLRALLHRCRKLGAPLVTDDIFVGISAAPIVDFREFIMLPRSLTEVRSRVHMVLPVLPEIDHMRLACADALDDARTAIVATVSRWTSAAILLGRRESAWELVARLADTARTIERGNADAWLNLAEAQWLTGNRHNALRTLDEYLLSIDRGDAAHQTALALTQRISSSARPLGIHVGNEAARQRVWSASARAQHGHGGATLVWGPAGIGKTRLLDETTRAVTAARSRIIRVALKPVHALSASALLRRLIADLLEEPGAAGCDPDAYRRLAAPNDLLSPVSEIVFHDLTELLAALTDESSLVIVIDDAHLVHEDTWPFWRAMFRWSSDRRLLWVLAARALHESELDPLPDRTILTRVPLCALDRQSAALLLASIGEPHDELFDHVGGNPLLLAAAAQPFDLELNARAEAAMEDTLSRLTGNDAAALLRAGVSYERDGELRMHPAWAEAFVASYPMSSPPISAAMIAF